MLCKSGTWMKISACLGVVLVLLGGITLVYVDDIYRTIVNKHMVLSPDSARYEPWRKSPYPLTFRVYLFNWTNPEGFREGIKPHLVEMGPYTYSEYDEKMDLQWHENHTVTYRQSKLWYFDAERSSGSLDDPVTTVNIVALTAANVAEEKSFWFRRFVSTSMTLLSYQLYSTHTVDELLFAGYGDNLLDALTSASYFTQDEGSQKFPYSKFGFFYMVNGSLTAEGLFNVATGADDISQAGLLKRWNHANSTGYYPGDCGVVRGTSGELWPPWRTKEDTIWLFAKGLCSSVSLQFEREAEVEGIPGYRYAAGADNFNNESRCYCGHQRRCAPSGARDIAACKFGSPMFLSFPHFFGADPHYVRALDGVRPDRDRHQFHVTVEPNTGVPLEIFGRTQFSMMLEAKSVRLFQDVPTVLLPVMWVEVEWRLSAEKASELSLLLGVGRALRVGCLVLLIAGVAAGTCALLLARRIRAAESLSDAVCGKTVEKENTILNGNNIPLEVNAPTSET